MLEIREERPTDLAARERLLDACFGDERLRKTCERLRSGRLPA
jgi:predicted N-acetyltransferase YhbS